jgi:hypothetical protein
MKRNGDIMETQNYIANELEGAGWPEEAEAMRNGDTVDDVLARLRDEHYPPEDLIEWLEGERPAVMFDRFALEIKLGNAAMQSGPDVADALRKVADRIENGLEARGRIRDANGNTVGEYGPEARA